MQPNTRLNTHRSGVGATDDRVNQFSGASAEIPRYSNLPCSEGESARLVELHQEIGRSLFTELQPLTKQTLQADVANLRLSRYSEFVSQALYPACTVTARGTVSRHHMAWYCPPVTTAYLLDAMLGGGRYLPPPLHRSLTHIERGLMTRLADVLWKQLETHWSAVTAMQLETAHLDSEGPQLRIAAANEMVLVVTWTLSNPYVRAMMQLLYPWTDVQSMLGQLHPRRQHGAERGLPHRPHVTECADKDAKPTDVTIDWSYTNLPRTDLQDLAVGDLLVTDVPPETPARVFMDGHLRFLGTVGQHEGRRAIRLQRVDTE